MRPRHPVLPAFETVAKRFAHITGLFDRLRRGRAARRYARTAIRLRIEARADAWMATAPARDIERLKRYALAGAHEVVDLLVLSALDGDHDLMENFTDTVDIFAQRVIGNTPDDGTGTGSLPFGKGADAERDVGYGLAEPPEPAA